VRTLPMIALAGLGLLAACGYNEPERAQGGAAAGAATGAGIGVVGGPVGVVAGGLIGGAAGATTGAVTSPHDVNLGPPPWSGEP
jgi:hypothetical protein